MCVCVVISTYVCAKCTHVYIYTYLRMYILENNGPSNVIVFNFLFLLFLLQFVYILFTCVLLKFNKKSIAAIANVRPTHHSQFPHLQTST